MAADDPLPGLLDLPLFAYKHFQNAYETLRKVSRPRKDLPLRVEALSGAATHSMDKPCMTNS